VNDVGEPCAGEPHARFDEAAGGNPGPVGYAAQSSEASRRPYGGELSIRLPLPAETGSLGKCERTLGEGKAGPRQEMPE